MHKIIKTLEQDNIAFSLCIKDLKNGFDFSYNEKAVVPSASTIKLPIMAYAMQQANDGVLLLNDRIQAKTSDCVPFSIISILSNSNSYTILDLITLMIVQSDNTATNILIDLLGIEKINTFIMSIGMKSTKLNRKMMDLAARQSGLENYTSAEDMRLFLSLLYEGTLVNTKACNNMINIMKNQLDRSMLYVDIPDDIEIAHKTGELDGINHDVGIIYSRRTDYIFSMLTWNAENNNCGRKLVSKAAKFIYDYFDSEDNK